MTSIAPLDSLKTCMCASCVFLYLDTCTLEMITLRSASTTIAVQCCAWCPTCDHRQICSTTYVLLVYVTDRQVLLMMFHYLLYCVIYLDHYRVPLFLEHNPNVPVIWKNLLNCQNCSPERTAAMTLVRTSICLSPRALTDSLRSLVSSSSSVFFVVSVFRFHSFVWFQYFFVLHALSLLVCWSCSCVVLCNFDLNFTQFWHSSRYLVLTLTCLLLLSWHLIFTWFICTLDADGVDISTGEGEPSSNVMTCRMHSRTSAPAVSHACIHHLLMMNLFSKCVFCWHDMCTWL